MAVGRVRRIVLRAAEGDEFFEDDEIAAGEAEIRLRVGQPGRGRTGQQAAGLIAPVMQADLVSRHLQRIDRVECLEDDRAAIDHRFELFGILGENGGDRPRIRGGRVSSRVPTGKIGVPLVRSSRASSATATRALHPCDAV